jgi:hypothetical protein
MFKGVLFCSGCAVVESIAHEFYFDKILSEHPGLRHFLPGRNDRHKNNAMCAEFFAGISKPLRVVARTGANDASLQRFLRQLAHHIISPPQFVRPHYLQVFALEPDVAMEHLGQVRIPDQGCVSYDPVEAFGSRQYVCGLYDGNLFYLYHG